jgi:predicted methyltransferase
MISSDLRISEDKVRQTIKRIKADKASDISDILNRALQADLAGLISALMTLFNACVTLEYHLKQFKKTQIIVLRKLKKSNYINSKAYQLITLLDIINKVLKSIMTKRLSNIVKTHCMLLNAQMRVRCK